MSNQWGRTTQVPRRGGSSAGFLLAALLCLMLIGAGAYGWYVRQGLQTEIENLTKANADLTEKLGKAEADRSEVAKEMETLKRNSSQWAGKLEQDYSDLQLNEVPKLNRLLDKRDAEISDLEKQIGALKAQSLRLAEEKTTAEAALKSMSDGQNTAAEREHQAKIDELNGELAQLRTEKSEIEEALGRAQSLLLAAQADAAASKSTLSALQDQKIPSLERELASEKTKTQDLMRQLAAIKPASSVETTPAEEPQISGRAPRNGVDVAALVNDLPGLSGLDGDQRRRLQDELASGACVTDALETVFDKVPLIVMRNLMRELKSDC